MSRHPEKKSLLAESLRPQCLSEFVGQEHLLAPGKPLRIMFDAKKVSSCILWGPPGVGKTSLARLLSQDLEYEWIALSAVFSGVKDIRAAMDLAEKNQILQKKTILFIDEIHRFNKAQQDALLPYTESGLVTLVGATTENPSFEINAALLSRLHVYVLTALSDKDLLQLWQRAKLVFPEIHILDDALSLLIEYTDGDGRRFLNLLEHIMLAADMQEKSEVHLELMQELLGAKGRRFDKAGDVFYDQISALHKSVRGSNPDAALYWLCRMLDGGVSAQYLVRRIVRIAWEDIGLADPRAIQIANDAAVTYERLGSPEGELALAQAVIYLAVAAKSNAGYQAFNQAMAFVKNDRSQEVPLHLRNAPTRLMQQLGHSKGYRYAHDEPHAYAAGVHYFPEGMSEPHWYQPVDRGLERKIAEKMAFLRRLDENEG